MRVLGGKGVLMLALVLGVATSYLSWRVVQQGNARPSQTELVSVLVAAQPIPQRTVVTPAMVQVKQIPAEARPPGAYANPSAVVGKVSKTQLVSGEYLLPHQFFLQRDQSGLAFMIPESHRAVAVAVSEVIGSGGLIIPGDRVDVFALFELQDPTPPPAATPSPAPTPAERVPKGNTLIALLLQDVEVLAVAQSLEGEDTRGTTERLAEQTTGSGANSAPVARSQPRPGARTVTLAVLPMEAEKLILAEERGRIRLALRPAGEKDTTIDLEPLELREVLVAPTRWARAGR